MTDYKPMQLLLIEDDVAECIKFKDCANGRKDVVFVDMTASSIKGLEIVKTHMPEGVILDLELHKGKGSGLKFLTEIKDTQLGLRPLIIVTTNNASRSIYDCVHNFGADHIFYKKQADYSPDMVLDTLLLLRESITAIQCNDVPKDMLTIESPEERRIRIYQRIGREMDLIGINAKHKGCSYMKEAIYLLLNRDKNNSEAVLYSIADNHKRSYNSVSRAIQTAINRAWDGACIEELQKHYTARVSLHTGVPTPAEFIHFYADKIQKSM
jgi:ActR/RegA family two-component response regulator